MKKTKATKPKPQSTLTKLEPGDGLNLGADGRCLVLEIKTTGGDRVVCGALDSPVLIVLESQYVPARWVEKRFGDAAVTTWREKYGNVDETGQLNNKVRIGGRKEKKQRAPKVVDPGKPKTSGAGRLGGYKGFAVTTVIRTLGKAGWSKDEVVAFCEREEIKCSPVTISIQLGNGKKGIGEMADFTPEFITSIRPAPTQPELPVRKVVKRKN